MAILNLSNHFYSEERPFGEKLEIEVMVALSLMSARKFIQAIEKFRKAQVLIMQSHEINDDMRNLACFLELLCADSMG